MNTSTSSPIAASGSAATTAPILKLSGIRKSFAKKDVLKGIDLEMRPGQLVALVGNNGQGKTTLMKIILGLLTPDEGEICLDGEVIGANRTTTHKALFGYLPETAAFYPNLTGLETLRYFCSLKADAKKRIAEVLEIVGLAHAGNYRVKTYSKGMRQRLGLAQALLGNPRILLLDEPTNGLDPSGIHEFYDILDQLKAADVAILMSSHLLAEIESRSDALVLIKSGMIGAAGDVAQLIREARLPGTIRFQKGPAFSAATLEALLGQYGVTAIYTPHTETYGLTCPVADKQSLLRALLSVDGLVADLVVNDPGLEQLFASLNSGVEIR